MLAQVVSDAAAAQQVSQQRNLLLISAAMEGRAHRSMFAAIFSRGTRLPADVIPKIVDYWAHLGWYEYSVPGMGSRVVATGPEESSSS